MAWYWYWLIFLGAALGGFYVLFYMFPQFYQRFSETRKKEEKAEEELIIEDDDPIKICPICTKEMTKDSLNGIIVDRCSPHGIWFDKGELKSVVDFVKSGGNVDGFFTGLGIE